MTKTASTSNIGTITADILPAKSKLRVLSLTTNELHHVSPKGYTVGV